MEDGGLVGYLRLSREEAAERGASIEQKVELRKDILVTIGRERGLALDRDRIVVELLSGDSLTTRPGLMRILEECRAGAVHTVIAFDLDRITRDVADLKTVTNAFFRGGVTLITQRDIYRFDKHFDTTLLQILAVLGEKERRSFSFRRRAANDQRTRSGQWSQGLAPYGYRWDRTERTFRTEHDEYPILEEILRRSWSQGAGSIARDLQRRGVRPPGEGKRENSAGRWTAGTVRAIVMNPFYAGHTVKRVERDRERNNLRLPPGQWIWSEQPLSTVDHGEVLPLPHPVSREEWEALQEVRTERRSGAAAAGLLTGILYCAAGRPMHRSRDSYLCDCKERGAPHQPASLLRNLIEPPVWEIVWEAVEGLRTCEMPGTPNESGRAEMDRRIANRQLREKDAALAELVRRGGYYRSLPYYGQVGPDGKSNFDRDVEALAGECQALAERIAALEQECAREAARPTAGAVTAALLLSGMRERLEEAEIGLQRSVIRLAVSRIDLLPPPAGYTTTKEVRVRLHALPSEESERTVRIEWTARNPRGNPEFGRRSSG